MTDPTFYAFNNEVHWRTGHGIIVLTDAQADQLLDLFETIADPVSIRLFHQLWDATREAQGDLWIERLSPFRPRVVAQQTVREMLLACPEVSLLRASRDHAPSTGAPSGSHSPLTLNTRS